MRHHKVPGGMKRRVLRWYDYSWSRGRIQGGGDINTALGLLPDKLKTELALHVNLSVLKKVTIFQECQPEFLHDLVLKMKAYIFTPGDSICRKGEVAREMFIIADGILEVLSETGKVLTTMKAGDFFGEIGILNLDGLNKRTADVRSVGYSELFSLSREDVLAAMKDYPEAQEILQTLGRKRLMEVRCVNKKYGKAQSTKDQSEQNVYSNINRSDSSENSASKKIVYKLRNDVKGIRSMLKNTRTNRRSDESLEMQPLHEISNKGNKTTLRRMSHVRSEDKEEMKERASHDKTPSPIGAGLPLLQRLRLLKEKQDREEKAAKSTIQHQISPRQGHVASALSPQESIQEEPETEVNEVPPLMQRLQLLKNKQEMNCSETKSGLKSNPAVSLKQKIQMLQIGGFAKPDSLEHQPNNDKLIVENVCQSDSLHARGERKHVRSNQDDIDESYKAVSGKSFKPSIYTSSERSYSDLSTKPWSKLKLATLLSTSSNNLAKFSPGDSDLEVKTFSSKKLIQIPAFSSTPTRDLKSTTAASLDPNSLFNKSLENLREHNRAISAKKTRDCKKLYHSVFDLSPEYSGLPFVKQLKILNERQKLADLEKALQIRSSSLDSSKTSKQIAAAKPLYRCLSDASDIYSQFFSEHESSSSISTNTSMSTTCNHKAENYIPPAYLPLSPELSETVERRKVKNILQRLHHSTEECRNRREEESTGMENNLLREPTQEGPSKGALRIIPDESYKSGRTSCEERKKSLYASLLPLYTTSDFNQNSENGVYIDPLIKSGPTQILNSSNSNQRTKRQLKIAGELSTKQDTHTQIEIEHYQQFGE
ncbi:LOW QUALITY PROTEIN: uncharacterized protein LOC118734140 [Rhagoletis pomonella]|uniref:LOW QUALITY PROTEIN: uncharacterized protein LOC118734140 n=1 Tax=Rhagoletis pomonella TaxID=28610 RepID=UPI0017851C4B|nr:LOW QUALITY PROTEIN: uncharacterized protein LOC118734140 [Rhagoletis pomonella]